MKIISQTTETLVRKITTIEAAFGYRFTVIDFINDTGNVVDSIYRNPDGSEVDEPAIVEQLETLMAEA